MIGYKLTKLPNKMQIITKTIQSNIATISMFVKVGSIYENKKNNGISHYLEHLFIGSLNLQDASVNGHTTKEMTSYIFKQKNEETRKNLGKILQNLQNPHFDKKTKQEELKNIQKEIEEIKNNKKEYQLEKLHNIFDNKDQNNGLNLSILGKLVTLSNLQDKNLIHYYKKHYIPQNIIFVVESNLSHFEIVETFCKALDKMTVVVGGYTKNNNIIYSIIKEMFNTKSLECVYLPYKNVGLLSFKYKNVEFTVKDFEETKQKILQSLIEQKSKSEEINEEIAYSKLYFNCYYNIDALSKEILKLDFDTVKNCINDLLAKTTTNFYV